jgi:hypothetical protein
MRFGIVRRQAAPRPLPQRPAGPSSNWAGTPSTRTRLGHAGLWQLRTWSSMTVPEGGAVRFTVDYAASTCRLTFYTPAAVAGGFIEPPYSRCMRPRICVSTASPGVTLYPAVNVIRRHRGASAVNWNWPFSLHCILYSTVDDVTSHCGSFRTRAHAACFCDFSSPHS